LQPERVLGKGGRNFIWIRRNPLKSPDLAKENKEMQAYSLGFIWFPLLFLGRGSRAKLYPLGFRR
jgi:hypothetical protein